MFISNSPLDRHPVTESHLWSHLYIDTQPLNPPGHGTVGHQCIKRIHSVPPIPHHSVHTSIGFPTWMRGKNTSLGSIFKFQTSHQSPKHDNCLHHRTASLNQHKTLQWKTAQNIKETLFPAHVFDTHRVVINNRHRENHSFDGNRSHVDTRHSQ